ncbi:MAG: tyrosine-protein phosphatase [Prevotella sp.]|nr:tyrosine-protein phosphatase [Prevotella sp.]
MNIRIIITFILSCFGLLCSFSQNIIPTRDYYVEIENEAVYHYLRDVVYEPHDNSLIDNYRKDLLYRGDWPNPVVMDIPQSTYDSLYIVCCDDETLKDSLKFHISAINKKVELYNFIPNRIYRYQIENGNDVLQQGKIYVSGQLRQIKVCSTVSNVRDLGGWKTADNMQIRYGKIFRGTDLNGTHIATKEGIDILRGLGVSAELDLRADYNKAHGVSAFGFSNDSSYGTIPTFYYSSDSGQLPSHLTDSIYLNKWQLEFQFIVNNLRQGRSIYEHCVWGRDRTGFLSFLLEGLLGMSYSDLVKEFELTYFVYYNSKSTKDSIDKVFDYIETMDGETLRDKFNTFFVSKIQAKQDDINFFRSELLEYPSSLNIIIPIIEKGNANDDEEVNEKDIVDIVNYMMGKQTSTGKFDENEADINEDNMINIADIVKIVKKIRQIR